MLGLVNKPYIDLEPFVSVEELKRLDMEICLGIAKSSVSLGCTSSGNLIPQHTLRKAVADTPQSPGLSEEENKTYLSFFEPVTNNVHLIYLRKSDKFVDRNKEAKNLWTTNAQHFPKLVEQIKKLPFKELGRVVIYKTWMDTKTPVHTDTDEFLSSNDFIWFNPRRQKKFYIFDKEKQIKHYVETSAAWFNERDFHGTEPSPNNTYSIRVDGVFNDELKSQLLNNPL